MTQNEPYVRTQHWDTSPPMSEMQGEESGAAEPKTTEGMNFFRPESEYGYYRGKLITPGKVFRRLTKATWLSDSENRKRIGGRLKNAAASARDAVGDLLYRIKTAGPHSQKFFFNDDDVIIKGYSTMNELNKTINAVRFSMFQDRNFSALDGFDAAVKMFADAAQQKKVEKKKTFWQKHKNKILTGAGALALAGGVAYGGYKWGQRDNAEAIKKLEEAIADLEKQKKDAYAKGAKATADKLGKTISSYRNQLIGLKRQYDAEKGKWMATQEQKKKEELPNTGWVSGTSGKGTLG